MASIQLPSSYYDHSGKPNAKNNLISGFILFTIGKMETWNLRAAWAIDSTFNDTLVLKYYQYPFEGISSLLWTNRYWKEVTVIFLTYVSKFLLVGILYYMTLFPFVLGVNTVLLGPFGVTIAVLHSFLHVNLYATSLTRLGCLGYAKVMLEKLLRDKKDQSAVVAKVIRQQARAVQLPVAKRHWTQSLIVFLVKAAIRISFFSLLFVVSFLPIVGVVVVKMVRCGDIGYDYSIPYPCSCRNPVQRRGDDFYSNIGKYMAFGITSGFLELLPVISGLTIASNYLGRATWFLADAKAENL